jgi:hypothetical protein
MKYGDFASLVQLGAGLHVGTALLQLYGELGVAPLSRVLQRTRGLFSIAEEVDRPPRDIELELQHLESQFEIFKIQLFQEFRAYVFANLGVAAALAVILVVIAFKADDPIVSNWEWTATVMTALSILPGPLTLGVLWIDANRKLKPMLREANSLEQRATRSMGSRFCGG